MRNTLIRISPVTLVWASLNNLYIAYHCLVVLTSYICTLFNNSIIYNFAIGMDKDRFKVGS